MGGTDIRRQRASEPVRPAPGYSHLTPTASTGATAGWSVRVERTLLGDGMVERCFGDLNIPMFRFVVFKFVRVDVVVPPGDPVRQELSDVV